MQARLSLARAMVDSYSAQSMPNWINWLQNLFTGAEDKPQQVKKDALGERGENLAAREMQKLGYRIIVRNFRCQLGEIDIIARDGKTLVFCEVKTRAADSPTPEEQVDAAKQHQITKAAKFYLGRYGQPQPPARFDVMAIVWSSGQAPVIRHTQDAFEATF